jgi:hypothetical protein
MTFKPATWYPIAVVLSVVNLFAAGFAFRSAEPLHAAIHVALGLAFGFWAQRLRPGPGGGESLTGSESLARLEALEDEVSNLRRELGETQERLDFAERVLAQAPEQRRLDSEARGRSNPI